MQMSFSQIEFAGKRKKTQKEKFLAKMEKIVPLEKWCNLIRPFYYVAGNGRPPIRLEVIFKMYLVSCWYNLSDEAAEDMLCENLAVRNYVGISGDAPDATTLCKFRAILNEQNLTEKLFNKLNEILMENGLMMKQGEIIDASFVDAPNSVKNADKKPNPQMRNGRKGKKHVFGMKMHIAVDKETGLIYKLATTTANESDVANAHQVLDGDEVEIYADAGYVGLEKRPEICEKYSDGTGEFDGVHKKTKTPLLKKRDNLIFHINKKRSEVTTEAQKEQEREKSRVRCKVEHSFCVIKHIFGYRKTRFRTVEKTHTQLTMLAALANLWRCCAYKLCESI